MTHPPWSGSRPNESTTSDAQPAELRVQDSAWNTGTHTLECAGLVENYSASGAARWHPERLEADTLLHVSNRHWHVTAAAAIRSVLVIMIL
jgi:hypothetical protein